MKTVSAKLYPTHRQESEMNRFLRVSCWVYNQGLEHRQKAWKRRRESVNNNQQFVMLAGWRKRMELLRSVPSEIERDALRRVDRGMRAFFCRVQAGQKPGYPRFKSSRRWNSFEVLQLGTYLRAGRRKTKVVIAKRAGGDSLMPFRRKCDGM